MIPHFAGVVADLLARGWIDIREPRFGDGGWEAAPMTEAQVAAALGDPDSWISYVDRDNRMVMLMTTDRWDDLVKGG